MSATIEPVTFEPVTASPTGLTIEDVERLDGDDIKLLEQWHRAHAGDDDGRPWIPGIIRAMPVDERLYLASDYRAAAAFRKVERLRVVESPHYFTAHYGSIQPESGPPIPFDLWPEQGEVLTDFEEQKRIIILKARQLGLTWLAIHYALWLMGYSERTPNAKVLALSKVGADAKKLLDRARKVMRRLPPYLRLPEDRSTRESGSNFKLGGRGEMVSLMGTPEAARMETATLAILDEFAHIRNRQAQATWTAVLPTLGQTGKAIVIFTGNGPADAPGDGQAAARLYERAKQGQADEESGSALHAVFLPSSTDPRRDEAFREEKRQEFLTEADFLAEYPETDDEALAGATELKVYSPAGINAAVKLGAEFDEMLFAGELAPPLDEYVYIAGDFGELMALIPIWPLEGGGIYVPPGEVVPKPGQAQQVGEACVAIHREMAKWQRQAPQPVTTSQGLRTAGQPSYWPLIRALRYDAAGIQSARTFSATVEGIDLRHPGAQTNSPELAQWATVRRMYRGQPMERTLRRRVPFGKFKQDTVKYLRHLFERTAADEATRIIAISPRNETLIRQLKGLETKDDGTGRVKKGDDDAPDALIAGATPISVTFRGQQMAEDDEAESQAQDDARAA